MSVALIEIDRETTAQSLKKAARRYAMTGGFELGLKPELSTEDLEILAKRFVAAIEALPGTVSERKNSNLGRVLTLIEAHPNASEETKQLLAQEL